MSRGTRHMKDLFRKHGARKLTSDTQMSCESIVIAIFKYGKMLEISHRMYHSSTIHVAKKPTTKRKIGATLDCNDFFGILHNFNAKAVCAKWDEALAAFSLRKPIG